MIGAGAASGGVMDASNLIKPALANGELRCIGSTTYQEYRGIFEKDHALTRRFQKIDVVEPTVRGDCRDPARAAQQVRGAPRHPLRGRRAARGGGTVGAAHQRPAPARQGDRRDRRGGCAAAAQASRRAPGNRHRRADRGRRRAHRADPAEDRVVQRSRRAAQPRAQPEARDLRAGPGDRDAGLVDQDVALRPRRPAQARGLVPVRRPDGRRQDRSDAPARARRWASNSSASTCPSTWSGTRSRA